MFFRLAYGWVYQYPVISVGSKVPTAIYNLNPLHVQYSNEGNIPTRLMFEKDSVNKVKETQFKYNEPNNEHRFKISDVIPFFDISNGLSKDFLLKAPSRLHAIQKNIKNIDTALCAENTALRQSGTKIVSGGTDGQAITKPLDAEDKKNIESAFSNYGNGNLKGSIIATNSRTINVSDVHSKLRDLAIPESIQHNALLIMNVFGIPQEMLPLIVGSGAKYDNIEQAQVSLVQNVVQNISNDYIGSLKSHFDIKDECKVSYEHLPCMQVIEEKKAKKAFMISQAIRNLTGTEINPIEYLDSMGINISNDG